MEITKDNIAEMIKDPTFISDILPAITSSEVVTTLIDNKSDATYKAKIGEEVSNIHKQYDDDMFEVLGMRPGNNEDGTKMKTYKYIKDVLYKELKSLKGQKESLTKDAEVIKLNGEIEVLKKGGGIAHIQGIHDSAIEAWGIKEKGYLKQIQDAGTNSETFQKKTAIVSALNQIKFNPDITESIKKMVLDNAEADLIKNSKFVENKLVFLKADGTPAVNDEYKPKSAFESLMSMEAIKDISLKADNKKGGGADATIVGSLKTVTIEGKDVKSIILPEGSFKTKTEFNNEITKALLASGFTRRDDEWNDLSKKAYLEHKVSKLPIK